MMQSLYTVDFISSAGTLRLLTAGDNLEADIAPKVSQGAARYAAIGAGWGESVAEGGAMVTVDFAAVLNHASHAALRGYCMRHAALFPSGRSGTLRLAISGGDTWEISDATLISVAPIPKLPSSAFETITAYSVTGGQILPFTALTLYPGIPFEFILQNWEDISNNWEDL